MPTAEGETPPPYVATINATCVRHTSQIPSMPCPYASCNDCCIVHSTNASADPELVSGGGGGGWSCMFLLHPTSTCANAFYDLASCTLTLHLVLAVVVTGSNLRGWCFSLICRHKHSTWTRSGFTHCNLCQCCFSFYLLVQTPNLRSGNFHCVVVVVFFMVECTPWESTTWPRYSTDGCMNNRVPLLFIWNHQPHSLR